MAVGINKVTKQIVKRNTPELLLADWFVITDRAEAVQVINQAAALVSAGVPNKYWDVIGVEPNRSVVEMTAPQKTVVDTASAVSDRLALKSQLKNSARAYLENHYPEDDASYYVELYANGTGKPVRRALIASIWTWKESVLSAVIVKLNEYNASATPSQVVPINFATFNASDPNVNLKQVIETIT